VKVQLIRRGKCEQKLRNSFIGGGWTVNLTKLSIKTTPRRPKFYEFNFLSIRFLFWLQLRCNRPPHSDWSLGLMTKLLDWHAFLLPNPPPADRFQFNWFCRQIARCSSFFSEFSSKLSKFPFDSRFKLFQPKSTRPFHSPSPSITQLPQCENSATESRNSTLFYSRFTIC
jgi:hypothetical protein